jgi:predicted glycosyltransferase
VWTLGAVEQRLLADGATTLWMSRANKDSVVELIEARGRPHVVASTMGTNAVGLARELLARDLAVLREVRRFRPDVILTRSPAGVHAGRLTRTPVLYDTDDGAQAGALFKVAGPLANIIATPEAQVEDFGAKHRRYRGYKELFYLHPSRFSADPSIVDEMGLAAGEKFVVLRLSAYAASHDLRAEGMGPDDIARVIDTFEPDYRVLISSEADLPPELLERRIATATDRFHHVLAAARFVLGYSQTVCSEAGILGTPSLRLSSWAGQLAYQEELEHRWGLTTAFVPERRAEFFAQVEAFLADPDGRTSAHSEGRQAMLEWCGDPADDLTRWTYELAGIDPPVASGR